MEFLNQFTPYAIKWLEVVLRWSHVLFSILWVGNSFLFNYLDNKLNKNIESKNVDGESFLMHSGYFYKLQRFKRAPENFPSHLIFFKWQSYLTFVTGIFLLIIIYYANAEILMVDKRVLDISPVVAIVISVLFLIGSWIIYDLLCKSTLIKNTITFTTIIFIITVIISFALTKIFGSRFAFLSLGVIIGSNMFGNVFSVIIPNQNNIVNSAQSKSTFNESLSIQAKTRSIHNNYATFLVLFIMLSGHYAFIWSHQYNWIILAVLALISAGVRHYFNLRAKKINNIYILSISILFLIVLMLLVFVLK